MGMCIGKIWNLQTGDWIFRAEAFDLGVRELIGLFVNPATQLEAVVEPVREYDLQQKFLGGGLATFILQCRHVSIGAVNEIVTGGLTLSVFNATICVVNFVRWFEYCPPIATIPPQIASLSPGGSSATVATTFEKKNLGSGVKGRTWASRPFAAECLTHPGVTTGIIKFTASVYPGKSVLALMMCVTSSRSIMTRELAVAGLAGASVAPWLRRITFTLKLVRILTFI